MFVNFGCQSSATDRANCHVEVELRSGSRFSGVQEVGRGWQGERGSFSLWLSATTIEFRIWTVRFDMTWYDHDMTMMVVYENWWSVHSFSWRSLHHFKSLFILYTFGMIPPSMIPPEHILPIFPPLLGKFHSCQWNPQKILVQWVQFPSKKSHQISGSSCFQGVNSQCLESSTRVSLLREVREGDELQWPPLMTGSALGGAEPPPGSIPVAEARNRLWKNFEEAEIGWVWERSTFVIFVGW